MKEALIIATIRLVSPAIAWAINRLIFRFVDPKKSRRFLFQRPPFFSSPPSASERVVDPNRK